MVRMPYQKASYQLGSSTESLDEHLKKMQTKLDGPVQEIATDP